MIRCADMNDLQKVTALGLRLWPGYERKELAGSLRRCCATRRRGSSYSFVRYCLDKMWYNAPIIRHTKGRA